MVCIEKTQKLPEFYGYYADYDWVVFCWLYGRMIDLPKGFPMYCRDIKQWFDLLAETNSRQYPPHNMSHDEILGYFKSKPNYPKQENEHNALDDAKWNYELYKFLNSI